MTTLTFEELLDLLNRSEVEPILLGVTGLERILHELDETGFRTAVEAVCGLFYIDLYDRPDLQPAIDRAEGALSKAGDRVVPILLHQMQGSDTKCHLHLARVLGRIGPSTLPRLRAIVATAEDPYARAFALFAIGKIDSEQVHEALPEAVGALMHPEKEVRDTAARTLGKIVERVPPDHLSPRRRSEIFEALMRATADMQAAVRAKAMRSLGKMARFEYLHPDQVEKLFVRLDSAVTRGDDEEDWDRAYIVRREAQEALGHLRREDPAAQKAPARRNGGK